MWWLQQGCEPLLEGEGHMEQRLSLWVTNGSQPLLWRGCKAQALCLAQGHSKAFATQGVSSQWEKVQAFPQLLWWWWNWQIIRSSVEGMGQGWTKIRCVPVVPQPGSAGASLTHTHRVWDMRDPMERALDSPPCLQEAQTLWGFLPMFALKTWSCGDLFPRVLEIERVKVMKIC